MADGVLEVDSAKLDTLKKSDTPVLVDFWAEWCGPCKMVAPVVEEIARENEGKLVVAKCNVDQHGELAAEFGVRSIPTLVVIKSGSEVARIVGALPKAEIMNKLSPHL